jgi:hypothetical protein
MKAALLESHCIVKMDDRKTNLDKNLASGRPLLMSDQPEQNKPLLIVGSGPSVSDQKTIDYIQAWPGDVWAINGAYDFLLDQGLICEGFFGLDPLPGLADYVRRPQEETTFYIASMCDPSVLETLKDNKLLLWHACAEDSGFFPEGHKAVIGGTTAVTSAPFLALALGYRDINLIGVDSSYDDEKGQYCYQWGRYATDINEMIVPGEDQRRGAVLHRAWASKAGHAARLDAQDVQPEKRNAQDSSRRPDGRLHARPGAG